MSKYRKVDADAAIAELRRRNPELGIKDDGRAHPAAYRLTEAKVSAYTPTEHEEQVALFEWAATNEEEVPALANLVAFPNGGYRPMTTAANLKAEGVKAGLPDMALFCKRGEYGALFIELKRADKSNGTTWEQEEWIARLRNHGYMAIVAYGCDEAIKAIQHYLSLDERNVA